jgi:hypothetical protein
MSAAARQWHWVTKGKLKLQPVAAIFLHNQQARLLRLN